MTVIRTITDVVHDFLSHVAGVRQTREDKWEFCCPVHQDSKPSATCAVGDGGLLLKCHACGATADQIVDALNIEMANLFWVRNGSSNGNGHGGNGTRPPKAAPFSAGVAKNILEEARAMATEAATRRGRAPNDELLSEEQIAALPGTQAVYVYRDLEEEPVLLVRRYLPANGGKKRFAQYHQPEGLNGWKLGVPTDLELYPWKAKWIRAAAAAGGRTVWVAEGEKCVLALESLGMLATCNPMGAGKWLREGSDYAAHFDGVARVFVLADPDEPGRKHAQTVARTLLPYVEAIFVLELPAPDGVAKWDVADFVEAGGTDEQLLALVAQAPPWQPPADIMAQVYANEDQLHCTDVGNAYRLVRKYSDSIRYCDGMGWLVWDGRRMKMDESELGIDRCAQQTALGIHDEARDKNLSKSQRKKLSEWAFASEFMGRLTAMVRKAQHLVTVEPHQLDGDPFLINVENGTVDLRTGALREARQADLITKVAPVRYDPDATCPTWERFLARIMDNSEGLISFLRRVLGYTLTGSVAEECCFILYGHGSNGKSTFIETVASLLGPGYARKMPSSLLLDSRPDDGRPTPELARLHGARFAHAAEVEEGRRLKEAFLKETTGRDTIMARYLRENPFEFKPSHKLFYSVNHKPKITGTDEGIWRRIHLIPFTAYIPPAERDFGLRDKLEAEFPGILNWAIQGALEWQVTRLQPPREVLAATTEYRNESDNVAEFVSESCQTGPGFQVKVKDLYAAYVRWCEQSSYRPLGKRTFNDDMTTKGFPSREGAGHQRVRTGLCLRSERPEYEQRE